MDCLRKYFLGILVLIVSNLQFTALTVKSQSCDSLVPSFIVDLSSKADSIWISPSIKRDGLCCNSVDPDKCIEFIVTLHPSIAGIYLDIYSGAKPAGAMYYVVSCDTTTQTAVGDSMCLDGPGPHVITFCKPGNNPNEYIISGIGAGEISPPVTIRDGCFDTIWAIGFNETTLVWNSVPADSFLSSFLSCTSGCDTVFVTPYGNFPDSVRYEVCGSVAGMNCGSGGQKCDTVTVYFKKTLDVQITPPNPSICFGGPGVTLTTSPVGGILPYSYLWNTGATTSAIQVPSGGSGIYWVQLFDSTQCPPADDTVFVFEFSQTISANAGPDDSTCSSSPGITLNGSVSGTSTGIWANGSGVYFPGSTSLNAGYLPSAGEISSGSVTLTLITTNTGSCPPDSDDVTITFVPPPTADAGLDDSICENFPYATLAGSVTDAAGGYWTTMGTGSFSPDSLDLFATYSASPADIASGATGIILTTFGSICPPAYDTMIIFIGANDVVVDAGSSQALCANTGMVLLAGSVTSLNPLIGGMWTTTGTGNFFPDEFTLNADYLPSPSDTISGNIILTLTSTNNGNCLPVSDSLILLFLPTTTLNAGNDTTICNDVDSLALNGSYTNAAGIIWLTSGVGIFSPSDTIPDPVYYFDPSDKYFGMVQLVLNVTGGCTPASDTIRVIIIPSVYAGVDQLLCTNDTDAVLTGTVSGAAGAMWTTSGTGYFLPDDSTLNAIYVLSSSDSVNGQVDIVITTFGGFGGCPDAIDTMKIFILPPTLADAGSDQPVCADTSFIQLAGNIINAPEGYWVTSGTGYFSPDSSALFASYFLSQGDSASDTVTLKLISIGGCFNASDSMMITVQHPPAANAGSDLAVCATIPNATLNGFVANAIGGVWNSSGTGTFSPDDTTLSGVIYLPSPADVSTGNVIITLTTTGAGTFCPPDADTVIIIYTPDSISVSAGPDQVICQEDSFITLTGSIQIAMGGVWTSSGSGFFIPSDSIVVTGYLIPAADKSLDSLIFTIQTTGNGGCLPKDDLLVVYLLDSMGLSVSAAKDTFCPSENSVQLYVSFQNLSKGIWTSSGDGVFSPNDSAPNAQYVFGNGDITAGTITLLFTSSDHGICQPKSDSLTLTIIPGPLAGFSFNEVCQDDTVLFTDSSAGSIVKWRWDFGDGSPTDSLENPAHNYLNWGIFDIEQVVTSVNGCTDTSVKPIIIHPIPSSSFTSPPPCFTDSAVFLSTSSIPADSIISWNWNFGDSSTPSTTQNPVHAYSAGDSFLVTLVSLSDFGCSDTAFEWITSGVFADFIYQEICENDTGILIDSSYNNVNQWIWDFGDGTPVDLNQNPAHTFQGWGYFDVTLAVSAINGCADTIMYSVTVHPLPVAAFTSTAQCFVDSAAFLDASSIPMDTIISWYWDFGDGNSSLLKNPLHLYASGGSYNIILIIASDFGCIDSVSQSLNVSPAPVANFTFSSLNNGCPPDVFMFADSSFIDTNYGSVSITGWVWDFGDSTAQANFQNPPPHTYDSTGIYQVSLIVTADNGCFDTVVNQITIHPLPVADFIFDQQICAYDTAIFTSASTIPSPDIITSWNWNFGDGVSSSQQHPSHIYYGWGNYGIVLTVTSDKGCSATAIKIIYVRPLPVAKFDLANHIVFVDEPIELTELSAGSTIIPDTVAIFEWLWSFDSGDSSTVQYPDYSYDTGGVFTISLEVVNEYGCRDTTHDTIIVRLPPLVPLGFSPNGDGQNDILFVEGGPYKELVFILYNEWGEIIFTANKQQDGWNGKRDGKDQPIGVYVWVLRATTDDDRFYEMWGEVTLLR